MLNDITETLFSHSLMNSYIFLTTFLFVVSIYCVLIPLNRLRIEYGFSIKERKESKKKKRQIVEFLSGPEQSTKNLRKIKLFLIGQSMIAILPLLTVILIRLNLGRPDDIDYKIQNLSLILILYMFWLYYNMSSSLKFRNMIIKYIPSMQKNIADKRHNPKLLFAMLTFSNMSRRNINKLSELEIPDYVETNDLNLQPMNLIDREKKVDSKAIIENLSAIRSKVQDEVTNLAIKGKEMTKLGMGLINDQINDYISKRVDSWTKQESTWVSSLKEVVNVIIPVVLIYVFCKVW